MEVTSLMVMSMAARFIGVTEEAGEQHNAMIMAMLRLDDPRPDNDEIPWCSAFPNYIAWLFRLPRSKSLRARSWLGVGVPTGVPEYGDIVVLNRGGDPSPDVIKSPGHVGFYAGAHGDKVYVLGGNQSNAVRVSAYLAEDVLGFRDIVNGWG